MDLNKIKKVYFVGIKGVGMTALACIGKDLGWEIFGSDTDELFVTNEVLAKKGINYDIGFDPQKVTEYNPDLVIYTAAHNGEENPQVVKAKELNIPIMSLGEALGFIANKKKITIAIVGVGGKTTTTAMLTSILIKAGLNPSYFIGSGNIPNLDFPGKYNDQGEIFITEADEYACSSQNPKPKFSYLKPNIIVIPNLAFDHPDIFKDENETIKVFSSFIQKLPESGTLIINKDSLTSQKLLKQIKTSAKITTYGESDADYRIIQIKENSDSVSGILVNNHETIPVNLSIAGKHNLYNAVGAIIAAKQINCEDCSGLSNYQGLTRRLQKIINIKLTWLYDDYAHHPAEIKTILSSIKAMHPNQKIITIFQAHTYSRTKALWSDFVRSFSQANLAIITDIFASAREIKDNSVTAETLATEIEKFSNNGVYLANIEAVINYLEKIDLSNTIILTLGAGNIFNWIPQIKKLIIGKYGQ